MFLRFLRTIGVAFLSVIISTDKTETAANTSPSIIAGSGAPSGAPSAMTPPRQGGTGTIYIRTSNATLYQWDGSAWNLIGNLTLAQTWALLQTFTLGIATDTIAEKTAATGVTVDGLLLKDGFVVAVDNQGIKLGTGVDDTFAHDGTLTTWTHATGNLVIDNTAVTGATYLDLGTDTNATKAGIRNNSGTALWYVTGSGVIVERANKLVQQGAPTAKTVSATLTAAEILAGIITVNQGAAGTSAQQLPTAADMDTGFPDAAAGDAFDFSVINTSTVDAEDASVTTNTGWTLVGSMDVHAYSAAGSLNSSARFRARKTGSAAWTLYRMS